MVIRMKKAGISDLRISPLVFLAVASVSFVIFAGTAAAVSTSVSQSGADSGTVMAGNTFTVTASGWSGDCTAATLDLSSCGVCSVSESTSKSITGSSVSWTTLTATTGNSQSITVSVSGSCSPESDSASFDVITAPSLSATITPSSSSVTQGETFSISLDIQNSGETTAQFGTISVSPSDFSISSGCSPSSITGGQSQGLTCTIAADSSATAGDQTMTLTITPTNADQVTKTSTVTVSASDTTTTTTSPGGSTGGPSGGAPTPTEAVRGKLTKSFSSIVPGTPKSIESSELNGTDTMMTRLTIEVNNRVMGVTITVERMGERPSSTSAPSMNRHAYRYMEIKKEGLGDQYLEQAKFEFRIEKRWFTDNSIDHATVAMYRWADGKWDKLDTTETSSDDDYYYFEATSPGLSYFAIFGDSSTPSSSITTTTTVPAEGAGEEGAGDGQTAEVPSDAGQAGEAPGGSIAKKIPVMTSILIAIVTVVIILAWKEGYIKLEG